MKYLILIFVLWGCGTSDKKGGESFNPWEEQDKKTGSKKDEDLDPNFDEQAADSLLLSLCYKGKMKEFNKEFGKFLKNGKDGAWVWIQKGNCFLRNKKYYEAKLVYARALGLTKAKSSKSIVYNNLGVIYEEMGLPEKSLSLFEQSLQASRSNTEAKLNMARLFLNMGLIQRSMRLQKQLENQIPGDPRLLKLMANSYALQGNFVKALSYFETMDSKAMKKPFNKGNHALSLFFTDRLDDSWDLIKEIKSPNRYEANIKNLILKKVKEEKKKESAEMKEALE